MRGREILLVLLLISAASLAADSQSDEHADGYVLVPAALWARAGEVLEMQQDTINALRRRLASCGKEV